MKVRDLVKFYGTQSAAADAIKVSRAAVSLWKVVNKGAIPIDQQIAYELDTGGKLRADIPHSMRHGI